MQVTGMVDETSAMLSADAICLIDASRLTKGNGREQQGLPQ